VPEKDTNKGGGSRAGAYSENDADSEA